MRRRTYTVTEGSGGMTITAAGVLITASIILYVIIHFWWVFVMIGALAFGVWAVVRAARLIEQNRQEAELERSRALDRMQHDNRAYNNDPYGYVQNVQDTHWNDLNREG